MAWAQGSVSRAQFRGHISPLWKSLNWVPRYWKSWFSVCSTLWVKYYPLYSLYFVLSSLQRASALWCSPWVPDSQIKHSTVIVPVCSFRVRSGTLATLVKPWVYDPRWPWCHNPRPPIGRQPWHGHANLLGSHSCIFPAWWPGCWKQLAVMVTRTMPSAARLVAGCANLCKRGGIRCFRSVQGILNKGN